MQLSPYLPAAPLLPVEVEALLSGRLLLLYDDWMCLCIGVLPGAGDLP